MQDLEQRYFERVNAAQAKFNAALDAARGEHDLELLSAREELNDKATGRFAVLFGHSPQHVPSEAARTLIEDMIGDALQRFNVVPPRQIEAPAGDTAKERAA